MYATVVIPFYNAETTLRRAIDSVLAQEGVALQVILVDNNSSDKSFDIAQEYVSQHSNIALHKESKQGANNARNLGLSLAQHEWIQYLDADDELLDNKIADQLSIKLISGVDVVCSPITEVTKKGKVIEYEVSEMGDIWLSLLQGKIGWTCSNLWRTSALKKVGGWNVNYSSHQEQELMARLIIEGKSFYFHNKSMCKVYEQDQSISSGAKFPLTGIKFMKFLSHHLQSTGGMNPQRKKALHTQLYHKYLMAYKINPEEAKNAMFRTELDLSLVDLPTHHQILTSLFGLQGAFKILRIVGS